MADDFEQHSVHALENPEKHLSNPVNAFLVVKRFTSDWDHMVDTYIKTNATDGGQLFVTFSLPNNILVLLSYCYFTIEVFISYTCN